MFHTINNIEWPYGCQMSKWQTISNVYIYIHIYIYKLIIKLSEPMYHNFHIYKSIQDINTYCNFKINFEF